LRLSLTSSLFPYTTLFRSARRVSHTVASPFKNSQPSPGNSPSPATTEDKFTAEAKAKATHDLEGVPGFASREDAESWLRRTLEGDRKSTRLNSSHRTISYA